MSYLIPKYSIVQHLSHLCNCPTKMNHPENLLAVRTYTARQFYGIVTFIALPVICCDPSMFWQWAAHLQVSEGLGRLDGFWKVYNEFIDDFEFGCTFSYHQFIQKAKHAFSHLIDGNVWLISSLYPEYILENFLKPLNQNWHLQPYALNSVENLRF